MDFFQAQDNARSNTTRLVVLFALAVISLVLMTNLLVMAVLAYFNRHGPITQQGLMEHFDWHLFTMVGIGVIVVILVGSAYKLLQLAAGGKVVAESLGGRLISQNSTDPVHRKILNVVEEMAIASGTPVPPVYVLEEESGINAFAAGYNTGDAVIGVTRGCIEVLSRDELQGVIAHEFSHILNGDMRMNIRLMGILHGILVIGLVGYFILRSTAYSRSSRRDNNVGPILGLGLGLIVIGFAGSFFGNWIKAALSRQREYLADASAVQFTRNTDGIAGALKKIGGMADGSIVDNPAAPEMSHAFFCNGVKSFLTSIFATHPPLAKRIVRLDRHWDGKYTQPKTEEVPEQTTAAETRPQPSNVAAAVVGAGILQAIDNIGQPSDAQLGYASQLLNAIPQNLREAAREPYKARAIIYSLVVNDEAAIRDTQLLHLKNHGDSGVYAETIGLLPYVKRLDRQFHLPLIDIAMGSLRQLSPRQYQLFKQNLQVLIEADHKIDLFEWSLQKIVQHHLDNEFENRSPMARTAKYARLEQLRQECTLVISLLAHVDHAGELVTQQAFEAAAKELGLPGMKMLSEPSLSLTALNDAIDRLAMLKPLAKPIFLKACVACITANDKVSVTETELLRAIANAIDCPMPPIAI
ncbi:MAG: M48 family metallopeptidase [Gammaproteobacteria bacterium]|jgi:Zn-dependent protease with chaperone function